MSARTCRDIQLSVFCIAHFPHVPTCSCSTVGAIMMTPLLTKVLAGQLVPVDAAVSGP